jgi:hypothetical protein
MSDTNQLAQREEQSAIGTARMESDGTIIITLRRAGKLHVRGQEPQAEQSRMLARCLVEYRRCAVD